MTIGWTDERVELLKKLWSDGLSASQIAAELGGITRNAVIGKVHRLGLSNRGPGANGVPRAPGLDDGEEAVVADATPPAEQGDEPAAAAGEPAGAAPVEETAAPEEALPEVPAAVLPQRRPVVPAGQPLPPQPSAGEISPETLASAREVEKRARRLTLMELTERTCKWPVGDPATPDFWFCGLPVQAGKPYCDAHVQVAFQPMSARRDRRR